MYLERMVSLLAVFICGLKKKQKKSARKRELNQKSDATRLIYNAVTHTFYNSLIALSTYR